MAVLLFNLTAGLALPVVATAPQNSGPLDIVICSVGGMLTPDGNSADDRGGRTEAGLCVFCLPTMSGAVDVPVVADLLLPARQSSRAILPLAPHLLPQSRLVGAGSARAPPSV